ncbi:MAG TPA: cytochrome c3 family protein [Thermodesulfobacteriota bacterium]
MVPHEKNRKKALRRANPYLKAGVLGVAVSIAAAGVSLATVAGTKHNFGSLSPAEVKSGETTEICVFCHTPHTSSPSKPIWNKQDQGSTYNVYESQTLAATLSPNSPALGQPTGASKLCLACHDGTIAIGSVLNLPGKSSSGELSVTGQGVTAGKISSTSTSYISTDLRDDHPISFEYSRAYPSNAEITDNETLPAEIRLDSAGMMQCTSCHDAHGTEFPKFLVAALANGGLCQACHDKRYWNTMPAVHSTSTAVWDGDGVNPWHEDMGQAGWDDDTPALQSCLACHRSHGGAAGKRLLKGTNPSTSQIENEEWTCLNCHNGNAASKDVEAQFDYPYRHNVKGISGAHSPSRAAAGDPARESAAVLGSARHAECADCHNAHGAKTGNHTIGGANGNIIGANILGSWGVKPSPWGAAGSATVSYQVVDFITTDPGGENLEGYLCAKCHSYYAYGAAQPFVPSGNADGSQVEESDITADFNVNNFGYHPVFENTGKNRPLVNANSNWPANGLGLTNTMRYADYVTGERTGYFNMTHESRITCTDCHSSDVSSDPGGAHGSGTRWISKRNITGVGSNANFCYNCHRRDVYGDEGYVGPYANYSRVSHPPDGNGTSSPFYQVGIDTGNNGNKFGILCLTCHGGAYDTAENQMKGIHGSNMAAGPALGSDPLGYRLMNGACLESYTRALSTQTGSIDFRSVTPATDKVCNKSFTNIVIPSGSLNYDCNTIGDCSN